MIQKEVKKGKDNVGISKSGTRHSRYIQLHGHIHADMEYNRKNKEEEVLRYDVGVDANQFCPVSVKHVIKFFKE